MPTDQLEQYIRMSTPFVSPQYKAVVGVLLLNNIISNDLEAHLEGFGLTYPQFNILRILKGKHPEGVPLGVIRERMLHRQSDVSRLVDRLKAMGLVDKVADGRSRKKVKVCLTEQGWEKINRIPVDHAGFHSLMAGVSEEDIRRFNEIVGRLIAPLNEGAAS